VIFQGVLGGMRVRLDETLLARIHGCFGPAFFALATALAVFTSGWWRRVGEERATEPKSAGAGLAAEGSAIAGSLVLLACVTALLAYVQIVLGSLLWHVPVGTGPAMFRAAVWAHLLMAIVLAIHILWLSVRTCYAERRRGRLVRPALALGLLVLAQLSLGAGTWVLKYGWPAWVADAAWRAGGVALDFTVTAGSRPQAWITTLHVAIGSLILATSVMLAVRMTRLAYVARCAAAGPEPAAVATPALGLPPGTSTGRASGTQCVQLRALKLPARPAPQASSLQPPASLLAEAAR
jgi:heme a synthase